MTFRKRIRKNDTKTLKLPLTERLGRNTIFSFLIFTLNYFNISGDITTAFIRENSNEVIQEMKGSLEDTYSAIYTSLFKIILKHVPYSEFFTNS